MNIFTETEGLHGEDLITALLRFLLIRSLEIRKRFLDLLSEDPRLDDLIELKSHFSCIPQHTTEDRSSKQRGRLDLLIETDNAIIGIENKLFAAFQPDQPQKYLDTVRNHAQALALHRQRESLLYHVVVIAPQSRENKVKARIGGNDHLSFVSWESILNMLRAITQGLDEETRAILPSFMELVSEKMAFIPKFETWVRRLSERFPDKGSTQQQRVVQALKDLLPDIGGQSRGVAWWGYNFCATSKDLSGWFGYVESASQINVDKSDFGSRPMHAAELILVTSFPLTLNQSDFLRIALTNKGFFGHQIDQHAWAINYDANWNSLERWRTALEPLNAEVQRLLAMLLPVPAPAAPVPCPGTDDEAEGGV